MNKIICTRTMRRLKLRLTAFFLEVQYTPMTMRHIILTYYHLISFLVDEEMPTSKKEFVASEV